MCTSIVEIVPAEGMAKRGEDWFPLAQSMVAYNHARHAPLGDVITLDFINPQLESGARAGVELTLESAKQLHAALERAIAAAEFEEAEVRGKGAPPGRREPAGESRPSATRAFPRESIATPSRSSRVPAAPKRTGACPKTPAGRSRPVSRDLSPRL